MHENNFLNQPKLMNNIKKIFHDFRMLVKISRFIEIWSYLNDKCDIYKLNI